MSTADVLFTVVATVCIAIVVAALALSIHDAVQAWQDRRRRPPRG